MELSNIIEKNEIITVVGAGGKTSFINYFANFYRDKLKVLLTTTTKIYVPNDYDNII
ncbi:putative selenium-dependent hydroxylase accessory protein YqeC, partial [Clostridioides difficile]|nr:putative selenium-dependent hydroxylase accessory protein YqeC [Clostridioides difficile]